MVWVGRRVSKQVGVHVRGCLGECVCVLGGRGVWRVGSGGLLGQGVQQEEQACVYGHLAPGTLRPPPLKRYTRTASSAPVVHNHPGTEGSKPPSDSKQAQCCRLAGLREDVLLQVSGCSFVKLQDFLGSIHQSTTCTACAHR